MCSLRYSPRLFWSPLPIVQDAFVSLDISGKMDAAFSTAFRFLNTSSALQEFLHVFVLTLWNGIIKVRFASVPKAQFLIGSFNLSASAISTIIETQTQGNACLTARKKK